MKVETLESLEDVMLEYKAKWPLLIFLRVPIHEEKPPNESCFDAITNALKDLPASTKCIFSCQMGRGRSTVGEISILPESRFRCHLFTKFRAR